MKKYFSVILFLVFAGVGHAEELRPQMRVWKSSALQGGNYSNVLMSSSPIIFHIVNGSATVNQGGSNYFSVNRSTRFPPTTDMSTRAFVPLNQSQAESSGLGLPWDVFSDSYTYFQKQGGAIINYEWDFYKTPPKDPFPKD